MKNRMRFYFAQYECVWSMNYTNAKTYLEKILKDGAANLDDFGKRIQPRSSVLWQAYNLLDADESIFRDVLIDIEECYSQGLSPLGLSRETVRRNRGLSFDESA